CHQYLSSLTF
nr:immunoglobulin light chain junction region [Mus musculus]NSM02062.1 immunoglobulin light chain junction region [Mus musculus]